MKLVSWVLNEYLNFKPKLTLVGQQQKVVITTPPNTVTRRKPPDHRKHIHQKSHRKDYTYYLNHWTTPKQIIKYQLSLQLLKIFNSENTSLEWLSLTEQIICTGRQTKFEFYCDNRYKIGKNTTINKLLPLNKQVELCDLNCSYVNFKRMMKRKFLLYGNT